MNETYQDYETKHLKDHVGDFLIRFNIYRRVWEAADREHYHELFSGDKGNVIRANSITTMEEVLNKKLYDSKRTDKRVRNVRPR